MGEGPLIRYVGSLGSARGLAAGGRELPGDDTCMSSCNGGNSACRSTGLVPELSLDVPDGTALLTAAVGSPTADSWGKARDDIVPELGVVMVFDARCN